MFTSGRRAARAPRAEQREQRVVHTPVIFCVSLFLCHDMTLYSSAMEEVVRKGSALDALVRSEKLHNNARAGGERPGRVPIARNQLTATSPDVRHTMSSRNSTGYVAPRVRAASPTLLTLAIIKPNAYQHRREILSILQREGFEVLRDREMLFNESQCAQFYNRYAVHRTRMPRLSAYFAEGPCLALVLRREDAIRKWRQLMVGDKQSGGHPQQGSLRARYGDNRG